ncbi:MAG: hypothetical protein MRY74_04715 [Neomegalonema sp.]|nr:hypothetical protein [Neomegalonema sp.]
MPSDAATPISTALWTLIEAGLLVCLPLVLLTQPGFMLYVAGATSRKNTLHTLYRAFACMAAATIAFHFLGRDIAHGAGPLIAQLRAAGLLPPGPSPAAPMVGLRPLLDLGFALAAYGVAASVVAGRMKPFASILFAALFAGVIYPIAAFAVWSPSGPLHGQLRDFAGSATVHAVGAGAALAATLLLRPRLGFNGYDPVELGQERLFRIAASHAPHHAPMAAQGVFVLWLGFLGLAIAAQLSGLASGAAALSTTEPAAQLAEALGRLRGVALNVILAPMAAVLTIMALQSLLKRDLDFTDAVSSALAGLAAIAAGADSATPEAALIIGAIGALIAAFFRGLLNVLSVDDPVSTISAHGAAGVAGAGLVGLSDLLAPGGSISVFIASAASQSAMSAALFGGAFALALIAYKVIGLLTMLLAIMSRRLTIREALRSNSLRVDYEAEIFGLDETNHGQDAYNFRSLR